MLKRPCQVNAEGRSPNCPPAAVHRICIEFRGGKGHRSPVGLDLSHKPLCARTMTARDENLASVRSRHKRLADQAAEVARGTYDDDPVQGLLHTFAGRLRRQVKSVAHTLFGDEGWHDRPPRCQEPFGDEESHHRLPRPTMGSRYVTTAKPITQCHPGQGWAATEMPMPETEKSPRYQIPRRLRAAVASLGLTNYDTQATKTNATLHGAAVGSTHPHGPTGFRSPWSGVLTGRP